MVRQKRQVVRRNQQKSSSVYYQTMQYVLKKVLTVLLTLGICYGGWQTGNYLYRLPYFEVGEIEIKGNHHLTSKQIQQLSGVENQQNIFSLDLQQVKQSLYAHPYIKQVLVERKLPHTVKIKILEREGIALLKTPGTYYLLDEEGVVLENVGWRNRKRRSVLEGLSLDQVQVGRRIKQGSELLGFLKGKNLLGDFARLDLSNPAEPVLTTRRETIDVYLGQGDWAEKMERFALVYKGLRARRILVKTVDLRYRQMVVVKSALKS